MDAIKYLLLYSLRQQTTSHIIEEDILNYSPTVMFRGIKETFILKKRSMYFKKKCNE